MSTVQQRIERALDGQAGADELADLRQLLAIDPDARRTWWEEIAWRSHLAEALAEDRAERSGRRFSARRRPAIGWARWAAAAVVMLMLAAVWLMNRPPAAMAVTAGVFTRADGLPAGALPPLGGVVEARGLVLSLPDGTRIRIPAGTVRFEDAEGTRMHLIAGRVEAQVARRPAGKPLIIGTAMAEAVVVGTRLSIDADQRGMLLCVVDGHVRVQTAQGGSVMVGAGEAAWADDAGIAARTVQVDPDSGPTLDGVCARLEPGDAVVIGAGTYTSTRGDGVLARIASSGTPSAPVRICAAPGAAPTLRSGGWQALHVTGSHVRLSGLDLMGLDEGPAQGEGNGIVIDGGRGVIISRCRITDFGGDGITAIGADDLAITDCRVMGNGHRSRFGQGGIAIAGRPGHPATGIRLAGLVVTGNRVTQANLATGTITGGQGVLLKEVGIAGGPPAAVITDCRVSDNQGPGLSFLDAAGVSVIRCTLAANGSRIGHDSRVQMQVAGSGDISITGCLLVASDGAGLFAEYDPTGLIRATDNTVWGGPAPAAGFRVLAADPGPVAGPGPLP